MLIQSNSIKQVHLSNNSEVSQHILHRVQFVLLSRQLGIIHNWNLRFPLLLHLFEKLFQHIIDVLFFLLVIHHISQQIVDFILTNLGLLSVQNEVLQFISILRLLLQLTFYRFKGFNGFHVHQCLLQLKLLIHQHFLPESIVLGLLLHFRDFFHILLCLFFLFSSKQFLCLLLEDSNLVFKSSLFFLKVSYFDIQVIECGFNLKSFVFIFICFRNRGLWRSCRCDCGFDFSWFCAKEPFNEVHYGAIKYYQYL